MSGNFPCPALTTADINTGDTAWILTASALVLLMTPGLGFFYGGLVRSKNVVNTLMMSYAAMGVVVMQWVLFGYSLAFSSGSAIFGGLKWGGLHNVGSKPDYVYGPTIPLAAHMNYQMMFAIITPALISGGIVERVKFTSYLAFILIWTTIVYDPLVHLMWSGWVVHNADGSCRMETGWLRSMGAIDFAGGTCIHISSGFSALVAAAMVGKRSGYNPKESQKAGNVPFVMLGMALLWFGWLGFNAGSAASHTAVTAAVNTSVASATAFTTWLTLDMIIKKRPSATGAATGTVIGLVASTPAAGYINPSFAILFGVIPVGAAFLTMKMKTKLRNLDDSLDVFYCHGVGGVAGVIMTGLFATKDVNENGENGAFYGNPKQLGIQLLAVVITISISVVATALILCFIKYTLGLALDKATMERGLDSFVHGETGTDIAIASSSGSKLAPAIPKSASAVSPMLTPPPSTPSVWARIESGHMDAKIAPMP